MKFENAKMRNCEIAKNAENAKSAENAILITAVGDTLRHISGFPFSIFHFPFCALLIFNSASIRAFLFSLFSFSPFLPSSPDRAPEPRAESREGYTLQRELGVGLGLLLES